MHVLVTHAGCMEEHSTVAFWLAARRPPASSSLLRLMHHATRSGREGSVVQCQWLVMGGGGGIDCGTGVLGCDG